MAQPYAFPFFNFILFFAHGDFPVLGRSDLQVGKTSGDMCIASLPNQGKTEEVRVQHQRRPAAAFDKPVAAHQAVPQQEHRPTPGWICHAQQSI